jgi:hypothetical protein
LKQTPEFTKILTQGAHILIDALLTDRACNTAQDIIQAWADPGINMPEHEIDLAPAISASCKRSTIILDFAIFLIALYNLPLTVKAIFQSDMKIFMELE